MLGAIGISGTVALLWLATAGAGGVTHVDAPDAAAVNAIASYLLLPAQATMVGAPFFAVGSTIFSVLLLRGGIVPAGLAWIGLLASVLLVVCLPLQIAGFIKGALSTIMWLPMLAFEVPLAVWLIVKGAAAPRGTARLST